MIFGEGILPFHLTGIMKEFSKGDLIWEKQKKMTKSLTAVIL